ncbi:hypothetical protein BJ170DRAFT_720711, partial [Xylariales sp. AK1849]
VHVPLSNPLEEGQLPRYLGRDLLTATSVGSSILWYSSVPQIFIVPTFPKNQSQTRSRQATMTGKGQSEVQEVAEVTSASTDFNAAVNNAAKALKSAHKKATNEQSATIQILTTANSVLQMDAEADKEKASFITQRLNGAEKDIEQLYKELTDMSVRNAEYEEENEKLKHNVRELVKMFSGLLPASNLPKDVQDMFSYCAQQRLPDEDKGVSFIESTSCPASTGSDASKDPAGSSSDEDFEGRLMPTDWSQIGEHINTAV